MKFVNLRELERETGKLIEQVHNGEKVIITKRGKPQAILFPLSEDEIDDLVLNSPQFMKTVYAAIEEGNKKGWLTLDDVCEKLGIRK